MPAPMANDVLHRRSAPRREVQMLVRFSRGAQRCTVMLKDLTSSGARMEGIDGLQEDEALSLALPGCKPLLAFVAWSGGTTAGVEFADPLDDALLDSLIAEYAVG